MSPAASPKKNMWQRNVKSKPATAPLNDDLQARMASSFAALTAAVVALTAETNKRKEHGQTDELAMLVALKEKLAVMRDINKSLGLRTAEEQHEAQEALLRDTRNLGVPP